MADTAIEWTDAVWNPTTGCDKVSPGCAHCYAEGVADRFWATQYRPMLNDGSGKTIDIISTSHHEDYLANGFARPRRFTDVLCHEDRLDQPLRWKKPRRIFVNSMSDLFHEAVPDAFILSVFSVMERARRHKFQILTKRAERARAWVTKHAEWVDYAAGPGEYLRRYGNVWLGVSVENQHFADARIPLLLQTPAAVRFISAEPLLESVDLAHWLDDIPSGSRRLDWVIVGGESGQDARPFDLAWARAIVKQCQAAGVACFVKQLGRYPRQDGVYPDSFSKPSSLRNRKGGDPQEWPADLRVRQFPEGRA